MQQFYKSILQGFAYILVFFFAVLFASRFGALYGVLTGVVLLLGTAFVKRATVLTILAQLQFGKDKKKAFRTFARAYRTGSMKPQHALTYAYLLLRDGQLEKSEQLIDKICTDQRATLSRQELMTAKLNRALIKWKSGDLKKAILTVQEIYDSNFKTTALYGVIGYFYLQDHQLDKALKLNLEAMDFNPDNYIIIDNLGQNYYLLGQLDKAEEIYTALLSKNPTFIEPYYNYGLVKLKQGKKDEAKKLLETALTYPEKFLSTVSHQMVRNVLDTIKY